jgi:CheY-like chemotaxis protein
MKTILQVEDDPNDVFLFKHAMRKVELANPIQVVSDGQEAIDYLSGAGKFADREQYPLPGLVLLDLKLPFVMGLDVLQWIRKQPGLAPVVIILTASAEDEDIASAYRLGANAFVTKPSEACKLQEIGKAIKDFWLTHNTLPRPSLEQRASADWDKRDPGANASRTSRDWHPLKNKPTDYERTVIGTAETRF